MHTSLLAAYARRGANLLAALALFDEATDPDLILWNATIRALMWNFRHDDAVILFRQMESVFAVTQHTTAWCSMQVVDITQVKHRFARIISLRVVQQKHMRVQGMSIELQL